MKILYWVSEDWYFVSHRLKLALKAKEAGHDIYVVTNLNQYAECLRRKGLTVIQLNLNRSGLNIFSDFLVLIRLFRIYKAVRPNIVHHVAMKPVVYGTLIARLAGVPKVINALGGLGYVFSSGDRKAKIIRSILRRLFRLFLRGNNSVLIVQNVDDFERFTVEYSFPKAVVKLIRGVGVDLKYFSVTDEPSEPIRAVLVARLLRDKGVYEFVEAARLLKKRAIDVELELVGRYDPLNPGSISLSQLKNWQEEGIIRWSGFSKDIRSTWRKSHISVLPSYREGLPKSLLEASACGRPTITTDVPGCREVVDSATGILVPAKNPTALADAIERLAADKELRLRLGRRAREKVEREFSAEILDQQVLALYV